METPVPHQSQQPSRSFADELRQLLRLAGPIAVVQLGQTSLNFVDIAMLGHHDAASLPAMTLGNTLAWGAMMFCFGALTAVDPLLSEAIGANDRAAVPRLLGRGALLAVVLSVPTALLLLPAHLWLTLAGQAPELIGDATAYAQWQALGVLPFLWYGVARTFLSAHARLWPQVVTVIAGNVVNAVLDWVLIFGKLGMPELGATGASLATVISRWLMLAGLLWFGRHDFAPALRALRDATVRQAACALQPLLRLLRLGAPIGAQFVLEMGVFGAVALLMGRLDAAAGDGAEGPRLAGHQIALQLASLSFMVPLGIGLAASVRVGWAVGRGDHTAVRRAIAVALTTGIAVMTGFMLLFLLAPRWLAGIVSIQPEHVALGALLIPIAGVFQIGDGVQVVAIGCLRGLGDVRSPMIANIVGFWLIGLPLGCWLTFGRDAGPAGLWWGLVIGLFAVALGLLAVLRLRATVARERLAVD